MALTSRSASHMLYSLSEGKWEVDPVSEQSCDEVALPSPTFSCSALQSTFPRPGRSSRAPARAANVNDGASAPPAGLVIDRSEHAGSFARHGVRLERSTRRSVNYPRENPIKC